MKIKSKKVNKKPPPLPRESFRVVPSSGEKTPTLNVLLSNIRAMHYQDYYNASPCERNVNPQMRMSSQAALYTLSGGADLVNGAYQWRGDGRVSIFYKVKRGDTNY